MKDHNLFLHFLFTVYTWVIAAIFLPLYFLLFMTSLLLLGYKHGYQPIRLFFLIYYLLFSPIRVKYHPDFDPHAPYVLVQNHVNVLDAFLVGRHSPNPTCGLMHAWQFNVPFYGWVMRLSKGIPVDPKRKDNIKRIVKHAKQRFAQGISIITFPEGGRTLNGKMKPFKKGVFLMAYQAGYPVVPVAVRGNHEINQKGSKWFWPHNVDIYVGKPIVIPNEDKEVLESMMQQMFDEMSAFIENGRYPDEIDSKI